MPNLLAYSLCGLGLTEEELTAIENAGYYGENKDWETINQIIFSSRERQNKEHLALMVRWDKLR